MAQLVVHVPQNKIQAGFVFCLNLLYKKVVVSSRGGRVVLQYAVFTDHKITRPA